MGRYGPLCIAVETLASGPQCAVTLARALLRLWWTTMRGQILTHQLSLSYQVRHSCLPPCHSPFCHSLFLSCHMSIYLVVFVTSTEPSSASSVYVLHFSLGETEKPCIVTLVDDSVHEEDEEFRLVLGTPKSKSPYGASIGEQKEALVTITDEKDSMCFSHIKIFIELSWFKPLLHRCYSNY